MNFQRLFSTIDTHTGGNPTRTLISGLPELQGDTMSEKMLYMEKNYDWIRKFLMNEPRGHGVMSGALITDPCHPDADVGVIYIETGGYLPMRSEEHTSELQSRGHLVCRLLLENKI